VCTVVGVRRHAPLAVPTSKRSPPCSNGAGVVLLRTTRRARIALRIPRMPSQLNRKEQARSARQPRPQAHALGATTPFRWWDARAFRPAPSAPRGPPLVGHALRDRCPASGKRDAGVPSIQDRLVGMTESRGSPTGTAVCAAVEAADASYPAARCAPVPQALESCSASFHRPENARPRPRLGRRT